MADLAADIVRIVASIVREPALEVVDFSLGGLRVNWRGLRRVGDALKGGDIRVVIDPNCDAWAEYRPEADDLVIRPSSEWDDFYSKGLLLHECVHALIDMRKATKTTQLSEEVAAYLAQVMYNVKRRPSMQRVYLRKKSGDDRIFYEAMNLIIAHDMMKRYTKLSYKEYKAFRSRLSKTSRYKDVGDKDVKTHDGLRKHRRRGAK